MAQSLQQPMKGTPEAAAPSDRLRSLLVEVAQRPRTAKAAADHLLDPLINHFSGADDGTAGRHGYGRKTQLAARMSELSGQSVTRDMIRAWLHPDPAKRRQPSFGYGLLLLVAAAGQMAAPE